METNDIFAFVIVSAILIAAAIPLAGIIFSKKSPGLRQRDVGKKSGTPPLFHQSRPAAR
jgi:hypothetical protein